MTLAQLYDFGTPLHAAVAAVFKSNGFGDDGPTIWTPLDDPALQKNRPRVEAVLSSVQGLGWLKPATGVPARCGFLRDKARKANLSLVVVTKAQITEHFAFVGLVMGIADTLGLGMNASGAMPFHSVQCVQVTGGSPGYKPETGVYETILNCTIDFSVKETAWDELEE